MMTISLRRPGLCNSYLLGPSFAFTSAGAAVNLQKLISGGHEVEAGTFEFGLAGRDDNKDVGVGCEASEDEVEPSGFDDMFGKLMGGRKSTCEGPNSYTNPSVTVFVGLVDGLTRESS